MASRMPSIARSTASAFAPCVSAARAASASATRTMIAMPSPSEIRWLRRRAGHARKAYDRGAESSATSISIES